MTAQYIYHPVTQAAPKRLEENVEGVVYVNDIQVARDAQFSGLTGDENGLFAPWAGPRPRPRARDAARLRVIEVWHL